MKKTKKPAEIKKILIVEDSSVEMKALAYKFSESGFDVVGAKNGEEGLWLALKEKPDLILLDIIMPRMDGLTMLSKLRQHAWGKKVPIVILSNVCDAAKISKALDNGVYHFLTKSNWTLEGILRTAKRELGIKPVLSSCWAT